MSFMYAGVPNNNNEQGLFLSQTSSESDTASQEKLETKSEEKIEVKVEAKADEGQERGKYGLARDKLDTGVSSVKQMNVRGTLILYFCIMTVLIFCCLGRCLVVPLSQQSQFEINSRKHMAKMDKNAFI
mmetsp:Transcript_23946/g.36684  ORF Transcript_23946/g.36684 Transcript_23946/m.36684 type:complete len:129 (+) Transcript_23946:773-1159(+)